MGIQRVSSGHAVGFGSLRPAQPWFAAQLALPGSASFGLVAAASWLALRLFGPVSAQGPSRVGAVVVATVAGLLYVQALRPRALDDSFEPNLVFLFAPIYLSVVASVTAFLIVLASWHRSRAEPV